MIVCVILVSTILRSDASLAIIAPSFIEKNIILQAYVFNTEPKQKVAQWSLSSNESFAMSFFHSVTHTPVVSTYVVHNGAITQIREQFITHGYGLPSQINDIGFETWEQKDGAFIVHMERDVNPLIIRVSAQYKTTLTIDNISYTLYKYDGESLLLKVMDI